MKKRLSTCLALTSLTIVLVGIGCGGGSYSQIEEGGQISSTVPCECITAQDAYNLVAAGQANLIDVRTLEEAVWVGSPALVSGGDPIAYLIPWNLWKGVDKDGKSIFKSNPDFDTIIEQTFGDNNEQALILMCRSGKRSTYAAERLMVLGYTNVYEIDNPLKEKEAYPGGHGGFQGSNYSNEYNGYRGYPERLPLSTNPERITVETHTARIKSSDVSVSWMDTGLPITQKIDRAKYLCY